MEIIIVPEPERSLVAANQLNSRAGQECVGKLDGLVLQVAAPGVGRRMGGRTQFVVRHAQFPISLRRESGFRIVKSAAGNCPVGSGRAVKVLRDRQTKRLESAERIKLSLVIVHSRVAGCIATGQLVIVQAVRHKTHQRHLVAGGQFRFISGPA